MNQLLEFLNTNSYLYFVILGLVVFLIAFLVIKRKKNAAGSLAAQVDSSLDLKLAKTKSTFIDRIAEAVKLRGKVNEELLGDLEDILLQADVGVKASMDIIEQLREQTREQKIEDVDQIQKLLETIVRKLLLSDYADAADHLKITDKRPFIALFVGVNGVGKTTSIAKLAKRFIDSGKTVMMIAADTFRAAAIEQLTIWAERTGAEIMKQQQGSDPSSVVYDGITKAINRKIDVVLIDTAGRQHTKINLMNELSKIDRTIKKVLSDAPHETLLVVDSTTGQNAITQAEIFNKATNVTGLILTKLDGTAKGGIVIGIKHQLDIPVKLIGVGETFADLRDFEVNEFVEAIFE